MRRFALGSLVVAVVSLAPGVAWAGDVSVPTNPFETAVFRASAGETNNLTVTGGPFGFAFYDSSAPVEAGPGCVLMPDGSASCEPEATPITAVEAHLNDEDDLARVQVSGAARVWAGPGDDTVSADSFSAATSVYGEQGDDDISAGGEGGQLADGGPGRDTVKIEGFAGLGTARGGPGDDVVSFRTFLYGPAMLDGGPGDDTIVSQPAGGTVIGGEGDDSIVIEGRVPLLGGDGFTISGGPGADRIVGSGFSDVIDGGPGRDSIDVLDGGADTVTCGAGIDVVRHDESDTVGVDCEILVDAAA